MSRNHPGSFSGMDKDGSVGFLFAGLIGSFHQHNLGSKVCHGMFLDLGIIVRHDNRGRGGTRLVN